MSRQGPTYAGSLKWVLDLTPPTVTITQPAVVTSSISLSQLQAHPILAFSGAVNAAAPIDHIVLLPSGMPAVYIAQPTGQWSANIDVSSFAAMLTTGTVYNLPVDFQAWDVVGNCFSDQPPQLGGPGCPPSIDGAGRGFDPKLQRTFVIDGSLPTVAISTPNASPVVAISTISGTAADPFGLVAHVQLWAQDITTGKYWSGSSFSAITPIETDVPIAFDSQASTSGVWNYQDLNDGFLHSGDSYTITAQAISALNGLTSTASSTFTFSRPFSMDPQESDIPPGCVTLTAITSTSQGSSGLTTPYGRCLSICPTIDPSKCSVQKSQISFQSAAINTDPSTNFGGDCPPGTVPDCGSGWTVPAKPFQSICTPKGVITANVGFKQAASLSIQILVPDQELATPGASGITSCPVVKDGPPLTPECILNRYFVNFSRTGSPVDPLGVTIGEHVYDYRAAPGGPQCSGNGLLYVFSRFGKVTPDDIPLKDYLGFQEAQSVSPLGCKVAATQTLFFGHCRFGGITHVMQFNNLRDVGTNRSDIASPVPVQGD